METPSSTRRITRSQTLTASNNKNSSVSKTIEDSSKCFSKSRQTSGKLQERTALIDLTNDSPIIGLAAGNLETPLSSLVERRSSRAKNTPGSGEAILRSQVKTLLQKVEEEAELSKIPLESRPFLHLKNFINSPMGLLAPTPANTPQIFNLHEDGSVNHSTGIGSVAPSPIMEEQLDAKVVCDNFDGVNLESEKSLLTRSLLLDFSDKSEVSDSSECSSVLTYQGVMLGMTGCNEKPTSEDDDASIWSIQVNASTNDDEEEEVVDQEEKEEEDDEMDGEEENDGEYEELVDELCVGIRKISMNNTGMVKFEGKHTRFVYNSDDELVEEQVCAQDQNEAVDSVSPNLFRLKGLPTPQGKHLRFHLEDEE